MRGVRGYSSIALAFVLPLLLAQACDTFSEEVHRRGERGDSPPDAAPDAIVIGTNCYGPEFLDAGTPSFTAGGCLHSPDGGPLAVFLWNNRTGATQTAEYGADNGVSPGDDAQGQPDSFLTGTSGKFAVPLVEAEASWTILGQAVTVDATTRACSEECWRTQLAGPDSYLVDTCKTVCGDGRCDEGERCHSCPVDCDCSALEPVVDCVRLVDDGSRLASFGYRNGSDRAAGIARGAENGFLTGDEARGQPYFFEQGEHHDRFQVVYTEPELTWRLGELTATASDDAEPCASECGSCPEGVACVGDTCRGACGDGFCADEASCNGCPADCGCQAGDICLSGACWTPFRCGSEFNCGVHDAYGVHIDCGSCADDFVCVAGACQPLCAPDAG